VPGQPLRLPAQPGGDGDLSAVRKGSRRAYWPERRDFVDTGVYDLSLLKPGHRIEGPAIIESEYTTGVIPPGRVFQIEEHGLGILETAS
jgi:N-methylhydantoinase A/oxoprolinase/acetone carboxylase beta subunit